MGRVFGNWLFSALSSWLPEVLRVDHFWGGGQGKCYFDRLAPEVFKCRYDEFLCSYGNQIAIASPNVAFPQWHRDTARNTESILTVQKEHPHLCLAQRPRKAREFLRRGGLRYQPKFDALKNQAEPPNEQDE